MPQTVDEILADVNLYSDEASYRFVSLPINAIVVAAGIIAEIGEPFSAMLVDKDEVTMMIMDDDFQDFQKRLIGHHASETLYRLITFDVELEPDLIGFMAAISRALADHSISIMPFAAFSRDHIFVPEADYENVISILQRLGST